MNKCDIMIFMIVSIITVCRNPGGELIKTLESVLAQDFNDFEYIIEDGASDDGTAEVINIYRKKFEKRGISFLFFSEKDTGIYDAMNRAVSRSSGDFVNFMNAGDCFYSATVLSEIFAMKSHDNDGILYGDAVEHEYGRYYMFRKSYEQIESRMPFSHQSAFVRRKLMLDRPFNTDFPIGADYDFLLAMYKAGVTFTDTQEIICIVSKDGVSSLKLYDTYMETLRIRAGHGIAMPSESELAAKRREMTIKQFVMDHFPEFVKKAIRRFQLMIRKQNADLTIPEWAHSS